MEKEMDWESSVQLSTDNAMMLVQSCGLLPYYNNVMQCDVL